MKNIHILPTDKPRRLVYIKGTSNRYHLLNYNDNDCYESFNIYITNDEEIKEGDWYLNNGHLLKCAELKIRSSCKKIILTTDLELQKDGVQAIPDDFLEWFVNHPSCEEVEFEEIEKYKSTTYDQPDRFIGYDYKIILPKEEAKQYPKTFKELFANTGIEPRTGENGNIRYNFKATMKQETLEEVALNKYNYGLFINEEKRPAFIEGAKWQQERSYSEEEVIEILSKSCDYIYDSSKIGTDKKLMPNLLKGFFEQFKKKLEL